MRKGFLYQVMTCPLSNLIGRVGIFVRWYGDMAGIELTDEKGRKQVRTFYPNELREIENGYIFH